MILDKLDIHLPMYISKRTTEMVISEEFLAIYSLHEYNIFNLYIYNRLDSIQ